MKAIKADCNICIKVHQRFDLAKWGVKKGDAYFKLANENLGKNGRWQEPQKCEGKERPHLLHCDRASAFELLITEKFLPPQFVCCASTPNGRAEVPRSPATRILFPSLLT